MFDRCKKKKCLKRDFHVRENIPGVRDWVSRAIQQANLVETTTVALLPSRTDSVWFQNVFSYAKLICFVRGRLVFEGAKETAPFPSVVAVFSPWDLDTVIYEEMTEIGNVIDPREGQIMIYGGQR